MTNRFPPLLLAFLQSAAIIAVLLGLGGMLFLGISVFAEVRYPRMLSVIIAAAISTLILTAYTYRMISDE